jgi:hypothetical protein
MTLQIELPAAVETALIAQAAAEGKDVSTFVAEAVAERLVASGDDEVGAAGRGVRPPQGFSQRLQKWIELHPRTGRPVDDSRESIYAGRGE